MGNEGLKREKQKKRDNLFFTEKNGKQMNGNSQEIILKKKLKNG